MCAEALSQEEIDALLRSHSGGPADEAETALASEESEVVNRYVDLFRAASEDVWGKLTSQAVSASLEKIESLGSDKVPEQCPDSSAVLRIEHEKDLTGPFLLLFPKNLSAALAGAMTGHAGEFSELEQSAFGEGQSQVLGSLCTQLAAQMKLNTSVMPAKVALFSKEGAELAEQVNQLGPRVVCAGLGFKVGEEAGSALLVFSNDIIDGLMKAMLQAKPAKPAPVSAPVDNEPVQPAVFDAFPDEGAAQNVPENLDLILDIGLNVRVELGRTGMKIRHVLELGPGSVIELDKLAGEPVDLLVNDKLFARGEVVVIDENFGVRVTDILSVKDRIEALGEKR